MLTNRQEIIFFSCLGALLLFFLVASYIISHNQSGYKEPVLKEQAPLALENISIKAKAAYVLDLTSQRVLYTKNEEERLPLASITKVMAALVASEIAPLYSTVVISREALATEGDWGLMPGERWVLKDLLNFSLVSSANDGMRAVALALGALDSSTTSREEIINDFVNKMNLKASEIGMKNTYFNNDTGLDESQSRGGAYGSAKDVARLFDYILHTNPTLLAATRENLLTVKSLDGLERRVRNTDIIVNKIPGIVASKTGYTDLAGGNLVIAFDPEIGHTIVISILGSSEGGRFDDMMTLVRATLASIENSVESSQ